MQPDELATPAFDDLKYFFRSLEQAVGSLEKDRSLSLVTRGTWLGLNRSGGNGLIGYIASSVNLRSGMR